MPASEHQACLLLGSNIQPEHYLPLAVELLHKEMRVLHASSVWETAAVGSNGPDFLNAALLVSTGLEVTALREGVLHPLEARLGRVRSADKNAARTMDIDLIIYDGRLLDANLWLYAFRAVPVAELLPGYLSANGERLEQAAARLAGTGHIRRRADLRLAHSMA